MVRRHQEAGHNLTKIRASRPKATRAEDNFKRVINLYDRRLTAPNVTAQLNQCCEKMHQHPLWEDTVNLAYVARIAARKPLLRKQNNVKCSSGPRCTDWTIDQWNKVQLTDESKVETFRSNRRVYECAKSWWKNCTLHYHTTKHKAGSVMVWGTFYQLQNQGFVPGKEQIESDWVSQLTATTHDPIWNTVCRSRIVFMQDNDPKHTCKLCQSSFKAKRNSTSFNWCLEQHDQHT